MEFDKKLYAAFEMLAEKQAEQFNEKITNADLIGITFSNRFKRKINRMFRERLGGKEDIPHPEVDNRYERIRSRLVRFFLVVAARIGKTIRL